MAIADETTPIGWAEFDDLSAAVVLATATPTRGTKYTELTHGVNSHPVKPRGARVYIEDADARYHDNGDVPTASIGSPIAAGTSETFHSADSIRNLKVIEQSGGAKMKVRYYV